AQAGDGSVVLVSGEPGIGKSRIASALIERLSDEPHTLLRSFCSPHHQDSALYPSITQLERAAGFRRDDTDEQRLDKLEAVLAQGTTLARPSPCWLSCCRFRLATPTPRPISPRTSARTRRFMRRWRRSKDWLRDNPC